MTVIGHSNGGFVGLVATTRDIKIDHLILLGLSVRNDTTRSAEGKIIQNFLNQKRKVSVIQPEQDEYASPNEVEKLKKENSLDIDVHKIQGNHYFEGFEEQLVNVLRKCI